MKQIAFSPPALIARSCAAVLVSLAVVAAAQPAVGATPGPVPRAQSKHKPTDPTRSRKTWATVDICESQPGRDTLGIRGSMAGDGASSQRMFMRFRVQYQSTTDHLWHYLEGKADSGFQLVGSARTALRQGGWTFAFGPPTSGSYVMRGVVVFEWRAGSRVVFTTSLNTTPGHRDAVGARPPGFSADTCVLT